MVDFQIVYIDPKWNKGVIKLAEEYNQLATKKKYKKMDNVLMKIEDRLINETQLQIRRDLAFLTQQIEERHKERIFPREIIELQDYLLGGRTSDDVLIFKEPGEAREEKEEQQFNIESIDLDQVALVTLEKIKPEELEKPDQKCAFGDGEMLDENGNPTSVIWRCKACKTVYHENCLRVCLLTKGSCQICDSEFLQPQENDEEKP
ncbi:MAG: hypothetical protein ACFFCS_06875 [Candidatus Hodarchaeota archaeon]